MYYKRTLSKIIKNASTTFPAVLINGPRQVGKTTLFEYLINDKRTYVSLDDPRVRSIAKSDPALFFKTYAPPILIDEIQYVPELFPYIKMIIDKEKKNDLFWLTGSQMFYLMKNITESLAGRVAVLNLQGLSQREKNKKPDCLPFLPSFELNNKKNTPALNLEEIYAIIWKGSYPRLLTETKMKWELFYDSYINTYIEKDVKALVNIIQEHNFLNFLKIVAARTGQLLNYNSIASDIGISVNTVKSWVSILETSGLIFLLYPYSTNVTTRVVKTPKLYFFDTGLVCYLTGWDTVKVLQNGAMNGAMLETYVISEIIKSYWHNGKRARVYFYRDKNQKEIDLIIEQNNMLYPIEIKRTANPTANDVKNFNILKSFKKNIGAGAIVCLVDSPLPITKNTLAIPLTYL
ncbi:MAG: ATP-binding protein [Endomicrobium sp.]|nr:ATP-binding protein [Endomicrobium sp.]